MLSEDLETENYISEESDQFTQTSASSVLFEVPLPKDTECINKNKTNTVFEYCQIIQDPEYPKSVTIVKEFVTEEVKDYSKTTGENSKAQRYKYTREVIHPFFTPKSDCTESCEVLVREALRSARKDFPDFLPSLEVYHSQKPLNIIKERIGESTLLSKVDAKTSYLAMDPDPDEVCLTDCNQAEDPKKCKQACKELNEARKSAPPGSPQEKPPCGVPVHRPPKCEKPPNCRPKVKKVCTPKSSSSNFDENQDEEVLINDLNTNKEDISTDEVIVIDSNAYKEQDKNPDEVMVTNSNTSVEIDEIKDKESKFDLGNIVPNIIFQSDSSSEKSFVESHNEAIATIKVAMEDFMGMVYKTTQDAVSLLATESALALAKIKAIESADSNVQKRETELRNKSSEPIKSTSFFKKSNEDKNENNSPSHAATVLEKVMKTADSALCILGSQITKSLENLPKNIRKYTDKTSPYDQPKAEEKSAHVFTPNATNGVFSALKNKIYSIFSDADPKPEAALSSNSSASSVSSKSDDDKK